MKDVLVIRLMTKEVDGVTRTMLYGIPNINEGDIVSLRYMNRDKGNFRVSTLITKSLDDWQDEDLVMLYGQYTTKSRLWNKLERAYRTSMPGNVLVTMVELMDSESEPLVENSVALVDGENKKTTKRKKKDVSGPTEEDLDHPVAPIEPEDGGDIVASEEKDEA